MAGVIRMMCPNLKCRRVLAVPATARGKTVKCRECGSTIRVPAQSQPAAAAKPKQEPLSEESGS